MCVWFVAVLSEHHLTRLVCENERLRLACKNETVLTIYSAVFGHLLHGSPACPQEPGSRVDMGLKIEPKVSCHIYFNSIKDKTQNINFPSKNIIVSDANLQIIKLHLFQSVCPLRLWGKCPADAMAGQTVQSWLTPWPLGTPAFPAPGNTCVCPSHVVRDEPDACCWYGSLRNENRKAIFLFCV